MIAYIYIYIYIYIYGNGWIQMGKGRSLGGSFGVKSPELDESGEGTTHDHRSLHTKAATVTHWTIKSGR